jgi:hypothetical protein
MEGMDIGICYRKKNSRRTGLASKNMTTADQIKCVEREIAMRRRVFPRLVERQKMSQGEADREIATMEAVLRTVQQSHYVATGIKPAQAE